MSACVNYGRKLNLLSSAWRPGPGNSPKIFRATVREEGFDPATF